MRFPQLCEALREALGTAPVSSPDYPGIGDGDAVRGDVILRHSDSAVQVGAQDRGEWVETARFPTEDEACAYILDLILRRRAPHAPLSAEEEQRSRAVTAETDEQLRRMFGIG